MAKIIVIVPGENPKVVENDLGLDNMQKLVGGYIECVQLTPNLDLWFNEEGLILDLPSNVMVPVWRWNDAAHMTPIVGTCFITKQKDGNASGLTDRDIELVMPTVQRWTRLLDV